MCNKSICWFWVHDECDCVSACEAWHDDIDDMFERLAVPVVNEQGLHDLSGDEPDQQEWQDYNYGRNQFVTIDEVMMEVWS